VPNKRREGWSITGTLTLGFSGHVAALSAGNRELRDNVPGDPALEQPWMVGLVWGYPRGTVWSGEPCRRYG
jgi:hypothetical protein